MKRAARPKHVEQMLRQFEEHKEANILPLPGERWIQVMQDETGDVLLAIERNMTTTLLRQKTIYHLELLQHAMMPLAPTYLKAWRGWTYLAFKLMRRTFFLDMMEV